MAFRWRGWRRVDTREGEWSVAQRPGPPPVAPPPVAPPDPTGDRPPAQQADSNALARGASPEAAARFDAEMERFFDAFPGARGAFDIEYVADPHSAVGGVFEYGWGRSPTLAVNLAAKPDDPEREGGWRVGHGEIEATVWHEAGHFLATLDGVLRGTNRHLRSMIGDGVGVALPSAIQTSDDVRGAVSREISEYGSTRLSELIAEAFTQARMHERPSAAATAVNDYFSAEYGPSASTAKLHALRGDVRHGTAYELPDGRYGRTLEHLNTQYLPVQGYRFVRTAEGTLCLESDVVSGLLRNNKGDLVKTATGKYSFLEVGEPLVRERIDRASDGSLERSYSQVSGVVEEVFAVLGPDGADEARRVDTANAAVDVVHGLPDYVADYGRAQVEGIDRTAERFGSRFVAAPNGSLARVADQKGDVVPLAQFTRGSMAREVVVEAGDGTRYSVNGSWIYGAVRSGSGLRAWSRAHDGTAMRGAVVIGGGPQVLDLGYGHTLQLADVKAVESMPADHILLSKDYISEVTRGRTTRLDNTMALWDGLPALESHDVPPTLQVSPSPASIAPVAQAATVATQHGIGLEL